MSIKCWQCGEELDTISSERFIYQSIINRLRSMMCANSKDDHCDLYWRHEDCLVIENIITEIKEKL
jgi:hypothetical protein